MCSPWPSLREGNGKAIWVALYGDDLQTIVPDRLVASDAADSQSLITILWNGTDFGLFYRTTDRLLLQRLTLTGDPIGAPIVVNPGRRPRLGDEIDVVWSDSLAAWVVAREIGTGPDRGIWVTTLEKDGTQRFDLEIPAAPPSDPHLAVAVSDSGVIGLFHLTTDDDSLLFTRIISGRFPETRTISTSGTNVQVAAAGELFVVTRLVGEGPTAEIRWLAVGSDDHLARPDGVLVAGSDGVLVPLGLTATSSELALTYAIPAPGASIADLHLRRFTTAGVQISDTRFAGGDLTAARALSNHRATWTGTSYMLAPVREATARLDSYLLRYCPLRAQVQAPVAVAIGQTISLTADVSGGVPGYTYEWTITRDPGGPRSGATIQRTFALIGPRLVTLVVKDQAGAATTTTFNLEVFQVIVDPPPPDKPTKRRAVRK